MTIETLHTKKLDRPEAVQIATAAVAIGLHYLDGALLGPEALAAAWTALAVPLLMACLRALGAMAAGGTEEAAP
jgi:hypothetical protein